MRLVLSSLFIVFSLNAHAQLPTTPYARFADLALACVHQEYPNKISHVLCPRIRMWRRHGN